MTVEAFDCCPTGSVLKTESVCGGTPLTGMRTGETLPFIYGKRVVPAASCPRVKTGSVLKTEPVRQTRAAHCPHPGNPPLATNGNEP